MRRGRQSGATVSTNPLDDWTADVEDNVNTFGAGATFTLVKDTWFLDVNGHYQKADGNNDASKVYVFQARRPLRAPAPRLRRRLQRGP